MNQFDPERRHVKRNIFLGYDRYLSLASDTNIFFVLFGLTSFLLGLIFYFGEGFQFYHRAIGLFFFLLVILSYGCRDKLSIANGVLEITYFFDLFGIKRVFKQTQYNLRDFDRAVVRWYSGSPNNRRRDDESTAQLYIESSRYSICLVSFYLRRDGQRLLIDFIRRIEPIIGLKIKVEGGHRYLGLPEATQED